VTALNDGVVDFSPAKLLTNTTPADVAAMLYKRFEPDPLPTSAGVVLVSSFAGEKSTTPSLSAVTSTSPTIMR